VDILLMAKNGVDGVYDADPRKVDTARRYHQVSHQDALERNLRVMDAAALSLCRENDLSIRVFDMNTDDAIARAMSGDSIGTLVSSAPSIVDDGGVTA
jgi:uridylate kinase